MRALCIMITVTVVVYMPLVLADNIEEMHMHMGLLQVMT